MNSRAGKFFGLVCVNGSWYLTNPEIDFQSKIVSPKAFFELLIQTGYLLPENSTELQVDHGSYEVLRYLSSWKGLRYLDYSSESALQEDEARMESFQDPYPSPYKQYPNSTSIFLSRSVKEKATELQEKLNQFLFWTFGRVQEGLHLGKYPVLLKAVPSVGARHPYQAYVLIGKGLPFPAGFYHYDVAEHALTLIEGDKPFSSTPTVNLLISVVYESSQWRYRHHSAYRDLLFDLGHIEANLKYVARELGLHLSSVEEPARASDWSPLMEECVVSYQIEGW